MKARDRLLSTEVEKMPPTCEEVMREITELVLCRNFKVTTHSAQLPLGNVYVLVTQSCPAPCDPMDCSLPGSSVHGILQARILEWVAIPQGIFPTRGSNPGFLHCREILYPLSHQGSPLGNGNHAKMALGPIEPKCSGSELEQRKWKRDSKCMCTC